MASRYVLEQSGDGYFIFTFQTHDGEILLTSPAHRDKDSVLRAINSTRNLARRDRNYEALRTDTGLVCFVLKNASGEVLGQSQSYADMESLQEGISLAKAKTRGARLEDLTHEK